MNTLNGLHTPLTVHTPGHGLDALSSVVLIVAVAGDVLQVVHVGSYQHGPQLHKVAVGWIFHCKQEKIHSATAHVPITPQNSRVTDCYGVFLTLHNAPWVEPPSHSLTTGLHYCVAADHCKRNALLHQQTSMERVGEGHERRLHIDN